VVCSAVLSPWPIAGWLDWGGEPERGTKRRGGVGEPRVEESREALGVGWRPVEGEMELRTRAVKAQSMLEFVAEVRSWRRAQSRPQRILEFSNSHRRDRSREGHGEPLAMVSLARDWIGCRPTIACAGPQPQLNTRKKIQTACCPDSSASALLY
jgi:hypothetical protein